MPRSPHSLPSCHRAPPPHPAHSTSPPTSPSWPRWPAPPSASTPAPAPPPQRTARSAAPSYGRRTNPGPPARSTPRPPVLVPDEVRLRRRILAAAHRRPRAEGTDFLTPDERAAVDRASEPRLIPRPGPIPLLPIAQLYARDIPEAVAFPAPPGADLLQLLWCPFDHAGRAGPTPRTELRWRTTADISEPLAPAPHPSAIGKDRYLPEPCVLHPEPVTEYPAPHELPEPLADRVEDWAESHGVGYQYDLAVAPGCKLGGHAPWSYTDPFPMACTECGAPVRPLLTIDGYECDGGTRSWWPGEATESARPTHLNIGRDHALQLYVCTTSYDHPHQRNIQ